MGFGRATRLCAERTPLNFRLINTQNGALRPPPASYRSLADPLFIPCNFLPARLFRYRKNPRKIPVGVGAVYLDAYLSRTVKYSMYPPALFETTCNLWNAVPGNWSTSYGWAISLSFNLWINLFAPHGHCHFSHCHRLTFPTSHSA